MTGPEPPDALPHPAPDSKCGARLSWPKSFAIALLAAVAGCLGTGALATLCVDWYRISSFEGGSGYFVLGLGCFGVVAGFVVGLIAARVVAARPAPGFLKGLGAALGAIALLLAIATFASWLGADLPPTIDGQELVVEVEVRLPEGAELPTAEPALYEWSVTITADAGQRVQRAGDLRHAEAQRLDGRWVVPATVYLATSQDGKALGVRFGGEAQYFRMRLPGRPTRADMEWSPWLTDATTGNLDPIPPAEAAAVRYRVKIYVEPPPEPPPPNADELEAEQETERAAAFAALTPESPFDDWLAFTLYSEPQERRQAAGAALTRRADLVAELSARIRSDDRDTVDLALRAVALLTPPAAELAPAVDAVGAEIAARIRTVNETPVEADPSYELAGEAQWRFAGWSEAARTLHGRPGVDLLPRMLELHELAQVRGESLMMQSVTRVAGYYVEQWSQGGATGAAPP